MGSSTDNYRDTGSDVHAGQKGLRMIKLHSGNYQTAVKQTFPVNLGTVIVVSLLGIAGGQLLQLLGSGGVTWRGLECGDRAIGPLMRGLQVSGRVHRSGGNQ